MKIKCVARTVDNQDGGYSITLYNTKEEMLAVFRKCTSEAEVSDEAFFQEDDGYENGYIDLDVVIEIDESNGKLANPFRIHAGQ